MSNGVAGPLSFAQDRTEELGLAGRLPIVAGGQRYNLRTLNLDESEEWLEKLSQALGQLTRIGQLDRETPGALIAAASRIPTAAMLELVEAYDLEHRLPTDLRKRFTQAELYAAVKGMVSAEAPFLTDVRSLAEEYGPQIRMWATGVLAANLSQQASFTNGPSPIGASTRPSSEDGSPRSGSSSSGDTANDEPAGRPTRNRSARRSRSGTATSERR